MNTKIRIEEDSISKFDENGDLKLKMYYANNQLMFKHKYFKIGDSIFVNEIQEVFGEEGNYNQSFYVDINTPDTINANEEVAFTVKLYTPIKGDKKLFMSTLKLSDQIKDDFSNSKNIYAFKDLKIDYDIEEKDTNEWIVRNTFRQKGSQYIKGIVFYTFTEFKSVNNNDSLIEAIRTTKNIFIKEPIYVR